MRCPTCSNGATRVIESRVGHEMNRRRRACLRCDWRFTTYEVNGDALKAKPHAKLPELKASIEAALDILNEMN
jgi:hypothetical protein